MFDFRAGPVVVSNQEQCAEYEKEPDHENEQGSSELRSLITQGTEIRGDEARLEHRPAKTCTAARTSEYFVRARLSAFGTRGRCHALTTSVTSLRF